MTTEKDDDWELHPRKPKKHKKDQEREKCIIHSDSAPWSNLIKLTQDKLTNLQNIKTGRMKEPAESPLRISANEYSMLSGDITIGDGYGYHRLCYDIFTKNAHRLPDRRESSLTSPTSTTRA